MRYLISSLVILALAVYLGGEINQSHSYVMVVYKHWVIQSSLWVLLCGLVLAFIALYFIIRSIATLLSVGKKARNWRRLHQVQKTKILFKRGLCQLAEGKSKKAEETLLSAAKFTDEPFVEYLAAAKAAQAGGAHDRRDRYLTQAQNTGKTTALAVGLAQARLQMNAKQWKQAVSTLQTLNLRKANHPRVLQLLVVSYTKLAEWNKCINFLPNLKKSNALPKEDFFKLEHQIYFAQLNKTAQLEIEAAMNFWSQIPKRLQQAPEFLSIYIAALLSHQKDELAYDLSCHYLKKFWDAEIFSLFCQAQAKDSNKQLLLAESWLEKNSNNTTLLYCLGQLCLKQRLWGKSKKYFERYIELKPDQKTFLSLAKLSQLSNDTVIMQQYLLKAMEMQFKKKLNES